MNFGIIFGIKNYHESNMNTNIWSKIFEEEIFEVGRGEKLQKFVLLKMS